MFTLLKNAFTKINLYSTKPEFPKKKIGFSFPTQTDQKFTKLSASEFSLLESRFKADTYSNKDIKSYLELFAFSPKIKNKSLALGIEEELYDKYALLFTALVKKNKIGSLDLSEINQKLRKNSMLHLVF